MIIIGITGGLATGKSTVAQMFGKLGAKVVNADGIVHQLLRPRSICFEKVVKEFGKEILRSGQIDRKKLADIVFKDIKKLRKLEGILHPQVKRIMKREINVYRKVKSKGVIVLDVPLLFEAGLEGQADYTIVVRASRKEQFKRAARLSLNKKEAFERIKIQLPLSVKARLADIIINNEESKKKTEKAVKKIWQTINKGGSAYGKISANQ